MKAATFDGPLERYLVWLCPGCRDRHHIPVTGRHAWQWNGDLETPTVTPSVLRHAAGNIVRCHSFLRAGHIEFCADSEHDLAGQTVPMLDLIPE